MAESMKSVEPIFLKGSDTEQDVSVALICSAAEKISGYSSICGAQFLSGLWRIYASNTTARASLLAHGITIKGRKIVAYDKNPYILRSGEGAIPSTKLTIDGVPISYSGNEITAKLRDMGVKLLGDMKMDRARDEDGRLTRWLTGRRWVWIETPSTPLPRKIECAPFKISLYHKEMKENRTQIKCNRCLNEGHLARNCEEPMKCWGCGEAGHRRMDCPASLQTERVEEEEEGESEEDEREVGLEDDTENGEHDKKGLSAEVEKEQENLEETAQKSNVCEDTIQPEKKERVGRDKGASISKPKVSPKSKNAKVKKGDRTIPEMLRDRSTSGKRNAPSPNEGEGRSQRPRISN